MTPERRVSLVLWITLGALAMARALVAVLHGSWLWGLDAQRFLPPALGWGTWALLALALVPALASRAAAALERLGDALVERPWRAAILAGLALAALVAVLPDRTWFVGDFLMRYGTVEYRHGFLRMFPQFMPGDVWLDDALPRTLRDAFGLSTEAYARMLGALAAALSGAAAVWFTRELGLRGAGAFAAAGIVALSPALCLCTGYLKPAAWLCALATALVAGGLRARRHASGLVAAGMALAIALLLHRSALVLTPAFALAAFAAWRSHARTARAPVLAGIMIPAVTLACLSPRLVHVIAAFDRPHHLDSPEIRGAGGLAAAAFGGLRGLDLLDLLLFLCPLALALPALIAVVARERRHGYPVVLAAMLALALSLEAVLVHPQQGLFRDWDVFAPLAPSCGMLLAALAAPSLQGRGRGAVALALVLGVAVPTGQWLWLGSDRDRGLARVEAFAAGPPRRGNEQLGRTLDFLGDRYASIGRWDRAAHVLSQAAAVTPSPRILQALGMAASEAGDLDSARGAFLELTRRDPADPAGWASLTVVESKRGDGAAALRAARELEKLRPGNPLSRQAEAAWGGAGGLSH